MFPRQQHKQQYSILIFKKNEMINSRTFCHNKMHSLTKATYNKLMNLFNTTTNVSVD